MDTYTYGYDYGHVYNGPDLYHYTSFINAVKIRESQSSKIMKPIEGYRPGDLPYGPGVYLTTNNPYHFTKEQILQANYPLSMQDVVLCEGKADAYFTFTNAYINELLQSGWRMFRCTHPFGREHIHVLHSPRGLTNETTFTRVRGFDFNSRKEYP